MARELRQQDAVCAIAQTAAVVGEWWSLLIVREVTRGHHRFDDLQAELAISRRVLAERLKHLLDHGVLERRPYQQRPTRYEYHLTEAGRALAPVMAGLQDWGDRFVLGDGALTAEAAARSPEADRLHALTGTRVPHPMRLPATSGTHLDVITGAAVHREDPDAVAAAAVHGEDLDAVTGAAVHGEDLDAVAATGRGDDLDVVAGAAATVVFTYPATGTPGPPGEESRIPGTAGCTLENRLFRERAADFAGAGVALRGVSTQRPAEQQAFADAEDLPFPLLSDVDLTLCAALRLPTFRAGQALRLKRAILVADAARTIRHVLYPVTDIPAAVEEALRLGTDLARRADWRPSRATR